MRVDFWRPPSPRSRRRARAIAVPGGKGSSRDIVRSREGETRACADFATMAVSPREQRRERRRTMGVPSEFFVDDKNIYT